jgi:glycerophosphoryl diester phosphodiesterase
MAEAQIPQLVAHRGLMETCPENSWLSLEKALQAGACWLECDVQMCSDGSFILLHDEELKRTSGKGGNIFELDPALLAGVSIHEPARFGERFFPCPPITLEQMLQRLDRYPQARVMVEIKEQSLQHWGLDTVMKKLLRCLLPYGEKCALISFSAAAIAWTNNNSPLSTGWVLQTYDVAQLRRAREISPEFLICNHSKIPPQETPEYGKWQWMLYDITDPELALRWAARSVQLIETRNIAAMLQHPLLATRRC